MRKKRKTLIVLQQRQRRREGKPLLLESDIIGNSDNIGNKNLSSMIINTTKRTISTSILEQPKVFVDSQQSITYPPCYCFNNRYQTTDFDFERFR